MLLILYAATLLVRAAVVAIDRKGALRGGADKALGALLRLPFVLPLLLAVPVAALLLRHEGWAEWWGIPTPDVGLVPNAAALGSYGLAFAVGWLVHRLEGRVRAAGRPVDAPPAGRAGADGRVPGDDRGARVRAAVRGADESPVRRALRRAAYGCGLSG